MLKLGAEPREVELALISDGEPNILDHSVGEMLTYRL